MNELYNYIDGDLFSHYFLADAIRETPEWQTIDDDIFFRKVDEIFTKCPLDSELDECQTKSRLIWPILRALGWTSYLQDQSIGFTGRDNNIDGLLFLNERMKERAESIDDQTKRFNFGAVTVECCRLGRSLGRGTEVPGEYLAPVAHMVYYLRVVDELSNGKLRWGILTNSAVWHLYYRGVSSVTRQYLGIDLRKIYLDLGDCSNVGTDEKLCARHCMRIFSIFFRPESFGDICTTPLTKLPRHY